MNFKVENPTCSTKVLCKMKRSQLLKISKLRLLQMLFLLLLLHNQPAKSLKQNLLSRR